MRHLLALFVLPLPFIAHARRPELDARDIDFTKIIVLRSTDTFGNPPEFPNF